VASPWAGGLTSLLAYVGPRTSTRCARSIETRAGGRLRLVLVPRQTLFASLNWTNDKIVHNYGWSIIW